MRTIAVANQKGGSAKTTTAVNLAAALAGLGRRVLLVDLDGQCSASKWFGIPNSNDDDGLFSVFNGEQGLVQTITETGTPGVDVVPASPRLFDIEKVMASEMLPQMTLTEQFKGLPEDWDVILLDCPPQLGLLTVNALVAANEVLIPVEISVMALDGLVQLLSTIEKLRAKLNEDLVVNGILPCRVDRRTNIASQAIDNLREQFDGLVLETVIRENVRFKEAPRFSEPILTYAPSSHGAADYRALAEEILQRHQQEVSQ
ncbi:MAG: ParA family protein [Salinibacter sp.]